jgi:copper transport protein
MKRLCGLLAAILVAFLLTPASFASAHASFVESNPIDGSVLAKSPVVAELRFSEQVLADASSIKLLQLGSDKTEELRIMSAEGGRTLLVDLDKLQRGAYILRYTAVDPADLHKTVGTISFGIGVAAPPSESGQQIDNSWLSIVARVVTNAALLVVVGAAVICLLLVSKGRRDLGQAPRIGLVSAWLLAVGWILLLASDVATVGFDRVRWGSLLLSSDPGRRTLVGLQLALGLWWAARLLERRPDRDVQKFIVRIFATIAFGFVVAAAYGGHAGIGGSFVVGFLLRLVHLGSIGLWIGAVATMWLVSRRDPRMRALWPDVSRLAAVGLAATGASGLLLSGRVASTVTALLGTTYGKRIVIKFALLVVLAAVGGAAAWRVRRGAAPRRVSMELVAAGAALVIAALLAGSAPARGQQFEPVAVSTPQIATSNVQDLTVSASIEPARPGPNLVQVRVLDTRKPSPGKIEDVVLRIIGLDGKTVAERTAAPAGGLVEWSDVDLINPGMFRVEVAVSRPSSPVSPFVASWTIDSAPVPRAGRVISTHTWAPIAAILAALWVFLVGCAWWVARLVAGPSQALEIAGSGR